MMMLLVVSVLGWVMHCSSVAADTDLSALSASQRQVWLDALSHINQLSHDPSIVIVQLGHPIEIPLYENRDDTTHHDRHIFKQNINKQVDCHLCQNQLNAAVSANVYDLCHAALASREVIASTAGIYVYTGKQRNSALGIILVKVTDSFQWFNGTKPYSWSEQTTLKNGTRLSLAFETVIYYHSSSDLPRYNQRIEEIIEQAHVFISNDAQANNLDTFFSLEKLTCQRHQQIVDDELRLLTLVCLTEVTFQCPLAIGSACWIENKRMANIAFNIDSLTFVSDRTITVRIDV